MSKGITKYCSIAKYLEHKDSDLYDLIGDLCLQGQLIPRKGSHVTFLHPDAKLVKKLRDLVSSNPEQVVQLIKSLILHEEVNSLNDLKDSVTALGKMLPVEVKGDKAVLSNGGVITMSKAFVPMEGRDRMHVLSLSGELVPLDTAVASADAKLKKSKSKKGGADLSNKTRMGIFDMILQSYCNNKDKDPAMEFLLDFYVWVCKKCGQEESNDEYNYAKKVFEYKCSTDTMASLAIILDVNGSSHPYISDDILQAYIAECNQSLKSAIDLYMFDVGEHTYDNLVNGKWVIPESLNKMRVHQETLANNLIKSRAEIQLKQFIQEYVIPVHNEIFNKTNRTGDELLIEAEVRAAGLILMESECNDFETYKTYLITDKPFINTTIPAVYCSTLYIISHSNLLYHAPAIDAKALSNETILSQDFLNADAFCYENKKTKWMRSHEIVNNLKKSLAGK